MMYILLDIDGVMVKAQSWKPPERMEDGFFKFIPRAVSSLNRILCYTGANIVLTSSHRDSFSDEKWVCIFKERNIAVASIAKLHCEHASFSPPSNRAREIIHWYTTEGLNEIFVVIDDDKSLNDLPADIKSRCIITQPLIGLNEEDADEAIKILTTWSPVPGPLL